MAAHAVCQHKKTRLPRVAIAHAVFVFFPASAAAYLKDREFHLNLVAKPVALRAVFLVSDTMLSN